MGLDYGTMKVETRLFNEEFLNAQANLEGPDAVDLGFISELTSPGRMTAEDLEDARLNRMQIMQDQKLDYAELTSKILKSTKFQRNPDLAAKENFLKSRTGMGAWGHPEESTLFQTSRSEFGKLSFTRPAKTAASSTRSRNRQSTTTSQGKQDICDRYSSLMRSESRGILTKHKQVVVRGSLALPRNLERAIGSSNQESQIE